MQLCGIHSWVQGGGSHAVLPAPLPPDRCALPHTLIKTVSLTLHGFKRKNKRRTEARLPVLQCHRVVGLIELLQSLLKSGEVFNQALGELWWPCARYGTYFSGRTLHLFTLLRGSEQVLLVENMMQ